jgi:hypothetical protein
MKDSFVADCTLLQALEKRSVSVPCLKGRMLFKQGEPPMGLYILKCGKASLVMKGENGAEVMHLTIGAGLNPRSAGSRNERAVYAECDGLCWRGSEFR